MPLHYLVDCMELILRLEHTVAVCSVLVAVDAAGMYSVLVAVDAAGMVL